MKTTVKPRKPRKPVSERHPGPARKVTPEVMREICARIASGRTISSVCRDADMPTRMTVYNACMDDDKYYTAIVKAREWQAEAEFDEHRELIDSLGKGEMPADVGRVMIQGLQWRIARMHPRVFGDKVDVEHGGSVTIEIVDFRNAVKQHPPPK